MYDITTKNARSNAISDSKKHVFHPMGRHHLAPDIRSLGPGVSTRGQILLKCPVHLWDISERRFVSLVRVTHVTISNSSSLQTKEEAPLVTTDRSSTTARLPVPPHISNSGSRSTSYHRRLHFTSTPTYSYPRMYVFKVSLISKNNAINKRHIL